MIFVAYFMWRFLRGCTAYLFIALCVIQYQHCKYFLSPVSAVGRFDKLAVQLRYSSISLCLSSLSRLLYTALVYLYCAVLALQVEVLSAHRMCVVVSASGDKRTGLRILYLFAVHTVFLRVARRHRCLEGVSCFLFCFCVCNKHACKYCNC